LVATGRYTRQELMKLRPEKTGDEVCFSAELLRKIVPLQKDL